MRSALIRICAIIISIVILSRVNRFPLDFFFFFRVALVYFFSVRIIINAASAWMMMMSPKYRKDI